MKKGNKIDVDRIDLDQMAEKIAENPGLLTYSHTVGGVTIRPEDKGKIKGRALSAMRQQTDTQMMQLYQQMETLVKQANFLRDRVHVSEKIYQSQINFEPIVGKNYYLYQRSKEDDTYFLSMVGPTEWGRSKPFEAYVAEVRLLADHTWEILDKAEQTDQEEA